MLPDLVSNPGPPTYESGALPIALRGPSSVRIISSGKKKQNRFNLDDQFSDTANAHFGSFQQEKKQNRFNLDDQFSDSANEQKDILEIQCICKL